MLKFKIFLTRNKLLFYLNKSFKLLLVYLTIIGSVGFSIFILEESVQQTTWACFAAKDVNRYDLLLDNSDRIETMNNLIKRLNACLMWICPIQMWAYEQYAVASDAYVIALRAQVFAHRPSLLIDRYIQTQFTYTSLKSIKNQPEWVWAIGPGGKIRAKIRREQISGLSNREINISGVIILKDNYLIIESKS